MFTARAKAPGFEMPRVEWLTRLERERGYDRDASAVMAHRAYELRGAGVPLEAATRQDV